MLLEDLTDLGGYLGIMLVRPSQGGVQIHVRLKVLKLRDDETL